MPIQPRTLNCQQFHHSDLSRPTRRQPGRAEVRCGHHPAGRQRMDANRRRLLSAVGLLLLTACAAPASPPAAPSAPAASAPAPADAPVPAGAPPAPVHIVVNWTAPSGSMGAIWLAHDTGIFREEGLDAEVVNVQNSSRVIPAMLAGEIALSPPDPATTVQANQGGADFVLLVAMRNRLGYSMTSQPSITQPRDLRG